MGARSSRPLQGRLDPRTANPRRQLSFTPLRSMLNSEPFVKMISSLLCKRMVKVVDSVSSGATCNRMVMCSVFKTLFLLWPNPGMF